MSEWTAMVEQAIQRCKGAELQARKERKMWETLKKRLPEAETHPFAILTLVDQLRKLNSPSVQELEQLETMLRRKAEEQILHYGALLREALQADGCTVEGRFSEGYLVNKVIKVDIDERRRRARIGTRFHATTLQDDISVAAVAEAVRKEVQRLFHRPFDAHGFLQMLWDAYLLALTHEKKTQRVGEHANIFIVHKFAVLLKQKDAAFTDASGKKFTPYLPDEFAVDIGKLLAEGVTQTQQGYRLHLVPVRNPKEALFIVNLKTGKGQNYGLVTFRSEQKEG
jgi:hypothetical protein